jgi:hypothetical protein
MSVLTESIVEFLQGSALRQVPQASLQLATVSA